MLAPFYASRVTIRLALWTLISCVLVFFTETFVQHPRGTSTYASSETLKNAAVAVGVTIAVEDASGSPFTESATEIAPAVPPSGTAMLPPKDTR